MQTATAELSREELDILTAYRNAGFAHRQSKIATRPTQPVWSEEQRRLLRMPARHYNPSFAQDVIEWMSQGYSLGALAGRIGVARSTIQDWIERFPEFGESVARARATQLFYWETKFIDAVERRDAAPGNMIMFALKNVGREDWKDKQEIEVSGQITFASVIERAMKTIEARRAEAPAQEPIKTTYQELPAAQDDLF